MAPRTSPWLIAALSLTSCVALEQPTNQTMVQPGEVQFTLAGPGGAALVVPVHVNGSGPYDFVLDTGATLTCVGERLAKELDLRDAPGVVGFGGTLEGAGAMRIVRIDTITVGDASAADLNGCVVDLEAMEKAGVEIDGLLGLNFLKAYRVTLDFDNRRLRLQTGDDTATTR